MNTIEEQLKEMILSKYKSVREFSLLIDMPYSTLDSIFKRGIGNASVSNIIRICKALNISADGLSQGKIEHIDYLTKERPDQASLSALDIEILNRLDSFLEAEAVKRHILRYLDLLAGETFVLVDGGLTPEEAEILVSRAEESAEDQSIDSHKDAG